MDSTGLVIERSRVRIPAGAAGKLQKDSLHYKKTCLHYKKTAHITKRQSTLQKDQSTLQKDQSASQKDSPQYKRTVYLKPVLNWANVCSPNILRTVRRTMIHFLTELLVRRTWFGQSKLYFVLKWLVMRCKLRPELAADAQQTA